MNALNRAIKILGSVTALAGALNIRQSAVSNWQMRGKVPSDKCLLIEQITKKSVTCYELRPDIFPKPDKAA